MGGKKLSFFILIFILSNSIYGQNYLQIHKSLKKAAIQLPSNQPRPWTWNGSLEKLINWTPEADPDREYNRGTIPLKTKFTKKELWVNPNAKDSGNVAIVAPWWQSENEAMYVSCGTNNFKVQTFSWWQYNDIYIMFNNWHYLPSVEMIDAAHKNGVKVYSLIMNPSIEDLSFLLKKNGDTFPAADKLIEIAEYYGFDGWFFNLEVSGNLQLAELMRDFLIYFNQKGEPKGIRIMWYDSWVENGMVSYQNELNQYNDWYFQYNDKPAAQEMFLNYWYTNQDLIDTRNLVESFGRNPWDMYAGFETWKEFWNNGMKLRDKDVLNVPHLLSLACFQMNGLLDVSTDVDDYYSNGEIFYSGYNHDPSNTSTTEAWKGIANWYPAKSVINTIPFVTNFSVGNGFKFFIDGNVSGDFEWNNRVLQDYLPTWRWVFETSGEKLNAKFNFEDAYWGGNSIEVSGNLTSDNLLKLFMTNIDLTSNSKFVIAYKNLIDNLSDNFSLALSFEDNPSNWIEVPFENNEVNEWKLKQIALSLFSGKKLIGIGLKFFGSENKTDYKTLIGRIGVVDNSDEIVNPNSLVIENKVEDKTNTASVRVKTTSAKKEGLYYFYYRVNSDSSLSFVGGSTAQSYLIPEIKREGNELKCKIAVKTVNKEFMQSEAIFAEFNWATVNPPEKVNYFNPKNNSESLPVNPKVSWSPAKDATSYEIYLGKGSNLKLISSTTGNEYQFENLDEGAVYNWRIDAVNSYGKTEGELLTFSTRLSGTPKFDRTDENIIITAQDDNAANGEGKEKAFDNLSGTKWLDFHPSSWIQVEFEGSNKYRITEYTITSANDAEARDPKDWKLYGSNDGSKWILVDERRNEDFKNRFQKNTYWMPNDSAYHYYKFEFNNNSTNILQLAEIELNDYQGFTQKPEKVTYIYPINNSNDLGLWTPLLWKNGQYTMSTTLHFGSEANNMAEISINAESYVAGNLKENTTYYWKVNALNSKGITEGELFSFTTSKIKNNKVTLIYEDFESGFNSFKSNGDDAKLHNFGAYAYEGTNAANLQGKYSDDGSISLQGEIDLSESNLEQIDITYFYYGKSLETGEGFKVEYFDGENWNELRSFSKGDNIENNVFKKDSLLIEKTVFEKINKFNLRFISNSSSASDDVYIDNIKLVGHLNPSFVEGSDSMVPSEYSLEQNFPNPFNPSTNISFSLPEKTNIRINVYNMMGELVEEIFSGDISAGNHQINWNANNFTSGVYFINLKSNNFSKTIKAVLLK